MIRLWDATKSDAAEQLAFELEHPIQSRSGAAAWKYSVKKLKARSWMNAPRDIFDGRSPENSCAPVMRPRNVASWRFCFESTMAFSPNPQNDENLPNAPLGAGSRDYTGAMLRRPLEFHRNAVLYTAQHLSLTCVEVLVHLDKSQLPSDYAWSRTETAGNAGVPARREPQRYRVLSSAGNRWIHAGNHLGVHVPSSVIPEEFNILLNPNHIGYTYLVWSVPRPFQFDPRLFVAAKTT